jgi:OOP family OmpA-OmpF porin
MKGYSELDDLLGRTGPLDEGTAPIFMPGDLLFAYDEAELQTAAMDSLRKLGTLILRNPNMNFLIEGHTDSFGTPEYNVGLSERRAIAVKNWLVEEMGIDPMRIRTKGLGSTRLVAPASESIEGQQLNRRVEIVLEPIE